MVLGWWYWGLLGVIGVGGGIWGGIGVGVVLGGGVVWGGIAVLGWGVGRYWAVLRVLGWYGGTAPVSHDVVSSSSDLWVL